MNKAKNQDQRILMCGACGEYEKVCCWKIDIVCKKRDEFYPNVSEGHMAYLRERKMWASDLELLHSENPEKYPAQGQVVELYPNEPVKPRKCVRDFARVMEEKLRENDHKSKNDDCEPWLAEHIFSLMAKLKGEVNELNEEVKKLANSLGPSILTPKPDYRETLIDISREAADVANYAMMVYGRCEFLKKCGIGGLVKRVLQFCDRKENG